MSESVGIGAQGNTAGGPLAFRHTVAAIGVFLQFWGVTLLVELFSRVGDLGNCGYRVGVPCQEGSALLGLGAPAFIAGALLVDFLARRAGWLGPAEVIGPLSFVYGTGGIGLAFAWNLLDMDTDRVLWMVVSGVIAILPPAVFGVLIKGFFRGFWSDGVKKWSKETFWILETLPQSKRKRQQMLRSRGVEAGRARNRILVPETRREKPHWALFAIGSSAALMAGVLTALLFVQYVS